MPRKLIVGFFVIVIIGLLGCGAVMAVPFLRESALYELNELQVRVRYALFPPEEAVFIPEANVEAAVQATLLAMTPLASATPELTATPTLLPDQPTSTPLPTATPVPGAVTLTGYRYIDQHGLWNYCAPANLAMGLSFWGWPGDRTDTGSILKPFEKDKNVMLYEMVDYVNQYTAFRASARHGGYLAVLKRLIAAGYPVLVEKGPFIKDASGKVSWMGHYALLTGYDDSKAEFISQDSYFSENYPLLYTTLAEEWRSFNYQFMVIYPPDHEGHVFNILGELADPTAALQIAYDRAVEESSSLSGLQQFFAKFNIGTSLSSLGDYSGAAVAFDEAFRMMPDLSTSQRPWRIMWYQTGPYFAYFNTGRYQDVINLADNTLNTISEPYLEESFVWRARARIALGDTANAADDIRKALEYHPDFTPATDLALQLGIGG